MTDTDIERLYMRSGQFINNIVDVFVQSQISIHILRAIEPNLRFGSAIRNYISISQTKDIPLCQYWNSERADKCIHLASRKQIGDALVRYEDRVLSKQ